MRETASPLQHLLHDVPVTHVHFISAHRSVDVFFRRTRLARAVDLAPRVGWWLAAPGSLPSLTDDTAMIVKRPDVPTSRFKLLQATSTMRWRTRSFAKHGRKIAVRTRPFCRFPVMRSSRRGLPLRVYFLTHRRWPRRQWSIWQVLRRRSSSVRQRRPSPAVVRIMGWGVGELRGGPRRVTLEASPRSSSTTH